MIRFLANPSRWVLFELGEQAATASLTVAWQRMFGSDPDFSQAGDAVAGIHFPLDSDAADVRALCVSQAADSDAVRGVIRLLIARYALDRVEILNRPPIGTGSGPGETGASMAEGFSWTHDLERHRYNADQVEIWPPETSRPIADKVVIEHADQAGHYVHRARRKPTVEWCLPATTLDEALVFSSVENAQAFLEKHAATEKNPLVLRYRSVALAAIDQSDAETNDGRRG